MTLQRAALFTPLPLSTGDYRRRQRRWNGRAKSALQGLIAILSFALVAANAAADNLTIGVATIPHCLPFFVAEHEGYFKEEAPTIRLVDCFPGKKCMEQLLAGKVQFATAGDIPIMAASFTRSDFVVLTTFASSTSDTQIVRQKNAGIASLKQLEGKRVGIIKGSSIEYFLDTVLLFDGIDPARVQKIDMAPDDMASALRESKIDAFSLFDPALSKAVAALGDSAAALATPPIYLSTLNLVAARSMVGKNDADMVKILRALDRAQRFIKLQPQAAQRILQERLHVASSSGHLIASKIDYMLSLDQTLIKTFEGEARWFSQQKNAVGVKPLNYLDYIYPLPLSQVKPKVVTIVK